MKIAIIEDEYPAAQRLSALVNEYDPDIEVVVKQGGKLVTIIDPKKTWKIDIEEFVSKSRNCPFKGWEVSGRAVMTIVGGEVKWELK